MAFVALVGAAGFRAVPSVFILPLEEEFGWSRATVSTAVSVNLVLYGLTAPFAAALMERFGIRRVVSAALLLVSVGSGLTVFMTETWQLVACWGVLVGLGTGSMALVFAATITGRWFERHRGLVVGVLTAGGATGQLIFLPVLAVLVDSYGWRTAALTVTVAAAAVVPLVVVGIRDRPSDVGLRPYGAPPEPESPPAGAAAPGTGPAGAAVAERGAGAAAWAALTGLADAARTRAFWALAGGFFICGASTNGLIGTHFVPAAHDHGMAEVTAAGLLAVVGVFDIVGTVASGWLTDRFDGRYLLVAYYALRGLGLAGLPVLLGPEPHPSMIVFIVVYGLDWVATVPPTIALCRSVFGPQRAAVVFGWVFASHQLGAAAAAVAAGWVRGATGSYTVAWYGAAFLCLVAAFLSAGIRPGPAAAPGGSGTPGDSARPAPRTGADGALPAPAA
ncbi:MFS transporter [Frankia sp. CNm7]|uniref:MFS transporter n=1 Tax=Frankia nepalensis TaxID=1836974 RepID=A0A937URC7_9ACTN|nr:MFS transporter [Frankia nepalensis]MBL7511144.1 MFS transporter [Frankia nepalensis]MBL7519674.1 MFS transporter [Frankia nepalensis]MBL7631217.1 MFS transporter [Frankia nepalensis]